MHCGIWKTSKLNSYYLIFKRLADLKQRRDSGSITFMMMEAILDPWGKLSVVPLGNECYGNSLHAFVLTIYLRANAKAEDNLYFFNFFTLDNAEFRSMLYLILSPVLALTQNWCCYNFNQVASFIKSIKCYLITCKTKNKKHFHSEWYNILIYFLLNKNKKLIFWLKFRSGNW